MNSERQRVRKASKGSKIISGQSICQLSMMDFNLIQ